MKHSVGSGAPKSRFVPMAWGAGALASVVMVLGVNGTLSSWTQAIINNDENHTQSAVAVALEESAAGVSCVDTATEDGNTATCSDINKYGGTILNPDPDPISGDSRNSESTTVVLKNTGSANGQLSVSADSCSTSAPGDALTTASPSVCDQFLVAVSCRDHATVPTTTTMFAEGTLDAFHDVVTPVAVPLAAGASLDCTFKATLPDGTQAQYSNKQANQAITWTLTKS